MFYTMTQPSKLYVVHYDNFQREITSIRHDLFDENASDKELWHTEIST